ncbi:hypothetical protein ACN47E_000214 [Coniothyrium glycines]
MDVPLCGWLEEHVEGQLLLGHHWLHDKTKQKEAGIKTESDRDWRGLYHDNGSCLDIINDIHATRASALQVIQIEPLTLADGKHHIVARLTHDAVWDLPARPPRQARLQLHSVIAVRRYTIRYTSYGPLTNKLQFIIHKLSWLGSNNRKAAKGRPLRVATNILSLTRQLDRTRQLADHRCLSSTRLDANDNMAPQADGERSGQSPANTQLPYTQIAFDTQVVPSSPSPAGEEEPLILGTRRLEPILAGRTQREEILPNAANTQNEKRVQLLSLLYKGQKSNKMPSKPQSTSPAGFVQEAFSRPRSTIKSSVTSTPSPRATTESQRPPIAIATEQGNPPPPSPSPVGRMERGLTPEAPSSAPVAEKTQQITHVGSLDDIAEEENTDAIFPGTDWMKGLLFNHNALIVDGEQRKLLEQDSSWHHPQPGVLPIPDGNVPIELLRKFGQIADDLAAPARSASSPSASVVASPPDIVTQGDNDFIAPSSPLAQSSQISWSPSPEPPIRPTLNRQGLPPDSSIENEALATRNQVALKSTSADTEPDQIAVASHEARGVSDPPSSPPVGAPLDESDEEMDMEEAVPHALGDDMVGSCPTVQVKETPNLKNRTAPLFSTSSLHKQESSGSCKDVSATSIVYSTYNDPDRVTREDQTISPTQTCNVRGDIDVDPSAAQSLHLEQCPMQIDSSEEHASSSKMGGGVLSEANVLERDTASKSASLLCVQASSGSTSNGLPNTIAAATSPLVPTTVSTKRKLVESPSKKGKRHSKRREIKVVSFDDWTPDTDPLESLRKDREHSLRRFRDERRRSISTDSKATNNSTVMAPTAIVLNELGFKRSEGSIAPSPAMSPRHRSLYDRPSPVRATVSLQQDHLPFAGDASPQSTSHSAPVEDNLRPDTTMQGTTSHAEASVTEPSSIYDLFKATYPAYTADVNHFRGLCIQMYELEIEDKMVPKWQWDDFIIRNRTDYKDYAIECITRGENAEPYFRFYKDTIRETLYNKGVLSNTGTLITALRELGVESSMPELHDFKQSPSHRSKEKSRGSLPTSFTQKKKISYGELHVDSREESRKSLPSNFSRRPHRSVPHRSEARTILNNVKKPAQQESDYTTRENLIPKPNTMDSCQPSPSRKGPVETTGDPYRDFVFGIQRVTSVTGSSKVDKSKPWPQNLADRPSVNDIPKRKVDVLAWKDVL